MISRGWLFIYLLIPFLANAQEDKEISIEKEAIHADSTSIVDKQPENLPKKKLSKAEKKVQKKLSKKKKSRKNKDTLNTTVSENTKKINDSLKIQIDRYIGPTKATFFSLLLPGLGQAYNKKYWKIPIVYLALYGAIATFNSYNNIYEGYRNAYARRLAGFADDQYYDVNESGVVVGTPDIPTETLLSAQSSIKETRELFLVLSIVAYMLNVVDASVDAHMKYYNTDYDLSLKPFLNRTRHNGYTLNIPNEIGISLNINF